MGRPIFQVGWFSACSTVILSNSDFGVQRYAVAISPAMQALIEQPDDPIGLQFIPNSEELVTAPHERADPIADDALSPIKGVVHRYLDRALLKPLLICPVYCRFCFRRNTSDRTEGC